MIHYIKLGKTRGLCIEINKNFGMTPFWRINSLQGETIIDIPYVQIIYTSGRWIPQKRRTKKPVVTQSLPVRRASNVNRQGHHATKRARGINGD